MQRHEQVVETMPAFDGKRFQSGLGKPAIPILWTGGGHDALVSQYIGRAPDRRDGITWVDLPDGSGGELALGVSGDLDAEEFLGPPEIFAKIDANGDGWLELDEALRVNEAELVPAAETQP